MKTFITSDTHFGHFGVCKFLRNDGTKLRPWDNPDEMDEALIENWNKIVGPKDKVYHLGDVLINRRAFKMMHKLHGEKVLIKGNHDIFRINEYLTYFKDVRAYHVLNNFIFSHIPIHPDSKARFRGNVHGHLHSNKVMSLTNPNEIDPWYYCVCVENTDFKPLLLDEVFERIQKQKEEMGVLKEWQPAEGGVS